MINKISTFALFMLGSFLQLQAQQQGVFPVSLQWLDAPHTLYPSETSGEIKLPQFEGATFNYNAQGQWCSYWSIQTPVEAQGDLTASISNAIFAPLSAELGALIQHDLPASPSIESQIHFQKQAGTAVFTVLPFRSVNGTVEKLVSFDLKWSIRPSQIENLGLRGPEVYTSVLNDGEVFKIGITQTGIYKLTYSFLKNDLGMANIGSHPVGQIQVFGNGGGMLPQLNITHREVDLTENAIVIEDGGDGQFGEGDYILFYGLANDAIKFNKSDGRFSQPQNIYSDSTYYFLKLGTQQGKRIATLPYSPAADASTVTTRDLVYRIEEDKYNLLAANTKSVTQGSGQQWFGDYFGETVRSRDYVFNTPNLLGPSVEVDVVFAGSSESASVLKFKHENVENSLNISQSTPSRPDDTFAKLATGNLFTLPVTASNSLDVTLTYPSNNADNEGWLDYMQVTGKADLVYAGQPLSVFNKATLTAPSSKFILAGGNSNLQVWDITSPLQPKQLGTSFESNSLIWAANTLDTLARFFVFDAQSSFLSATALGVVGQQNLHGIEEADMLIVYFEGFKAAAEKMAEHRRTKDGFVVQTVEMQLIYNEFGCGVPDPTALRDFVRMIHKRDPNFKYLLLLGDGSFDTRGRMAKTNNSAFIPVMETTVSLSGLNAYPWDDFFGLLSDNEGQLPGVGFLEIAVGRLPVSTDEEALKTVEKIIRYETAPERFGNWRNRISFVGDDNESNLHSNQSDDVADLVAQKNPRFNQNKIFIDAYPKSFGAGGQRVPGASDDINKDMFKGLLAMVYLGHGGPSGWAQERILRQEFIDTWNNPNGMPIMITATCTFSGYDNPFNKSAGEQCFLNTAGGPVAMMTTVRSVFSDSNFKLTKSICDTLFTKVNGQPMRIGEGIVYAKTVNTNAIENARRFCLLGDPAMRIATPLFNVSTTHINGVPVATTTDTVKALQTITIKGLITDDNGQINTQFNGLIYPSIYDKPIALQTLGQEEAGGTKVNYSLQKNVLFNGAATVTDGAFEFTFVMPLDINYAVGVGKISYYATDGVAVDASGYYPLIVGGIDVNAPQDDTAPTVEVFINNFDFKSGGKTDPTPLLLAKVKDNLGVNVTGSSIGHDLVSVLNENTQTTYILNDFYSSTVNDHTSGTVNYPLSKLPEGRYKVVVRAWDVANNVGEGFTEFVVASDAQLAITDILCYPNPLFSDNAHFGFTHNFGAEALAVTIDILDLLGRNVRTINTTVNTDGGAVTNILWDGTDTYGAALTQGLYLYRISVKRNAGTENQTLTTTLEQLVLMK